MSRVEDRPAAEARATTLAEALARIRAVQPAALRRFHVQGTVFDGNGGEWERVALELYTDLCETESIARAALAEDADRP